MLFSACLGHCDPCGCFHQSAGGPMWVVSGAQGCASVEPVLDASGWQGRLSCPRAAGGWEAGGGMVPSAAIAGVESAW